MRALAKIVSEDVGMVNVNAFMHASLEDKLDQKTSIKAQYTDSIVNEQNRGTDKAMADGI